MSRLPAELHSRKAFGKYPGLFSFNTNPGLWLGTGTPLDTQVRGTDQAT
jgi:hypothetical protein